MAMSNISPKYKNIISKSTLISSGCPVVYQYRPKKELFENITRMTVGEKNVDKPNKTILFVGETGTGKSTMMNALINYAMGVEWEDNIWFDIIEEEKRDQSESQTSDVIVYHIFGFEGKTLPYSLTLIDTPGFGDTKGIHTDDIISQRLYSLFKSEDGVRAVDAVALVLKASINRVDERVRYVFDAVMSLFGNDMEKIIVLLFTHSTGKTPRNAFKALENANIKCAKDQKNLPVHFLFENSQKDDRSQDTDLLNKEFTLSWTGMKTFTASLEKTNSQETGKTVDVIAKRTSLIACIQNLRERIKLSELEQAKIQQIQTALKKQEEKMEKNENFSILVDKPYKDLESIKGGRWGWGLFYEGATRCTFCEENCHYPGCTAVTNPSWCTVMKKDHCISCTNKCPVSKHVKDEYIYVAKTRKEEETVKEIKKEYDNAKTQAEEQQSLLQKVEQSIQVQKLGQSKSLDEAYQHIVTLDQIALNIKSLSIHIHLDFLIEKMKEKGDTEKVQKLKEIKGREDSRKIQSSLQYMFNALTKPFRS